MLKARTPRTSEAIDPNWARLGKIPSPVIGGADSTCGSLGRKSSRGLSTARVPLGIKPVLFVNSPFAFTDALGSVPSSFPGRGRQRVSGLSGIRLSLGGDRRARRCAPKLSDRARYTRNCDSASVGQYDLHETERCLTGRQNESPAETRRALVAVYAPDCAECPTASEVDQLALSLFQLPRSAVSDHWCPCESAVGWVCAQSGAEATLPDEPARRR